MSFYKLYLGSTNLFPKYSPVYWGTTLACFKAAKKPVYFRSKQKCLLNKKFLDFKSLLTKINVNLKNKKVC